MTYVLNYVDDAIIFNKRLAHVEKFKNELSERFKITTDKSLSRYLGIEIARTKNGFLLTQQRLVDSIYEKAKTYIVKYNIASMDVPIKFNRLKKANSQPTPEEHLELKQLPFRSLLGAVGYLMTSTIPSISYAYKEISRFAADYRMEHFTALLELITFIKKHPTPLSSVSRGEMSSLRTQIATGTTPNYICQQPDSSCFTETIRFLGPAGRSATQHARWANQNSCRYRAVHKSCSTCVCSRHPYSNRLTSDVQVRSYLLLGRSLGPHVRATTLKGLVTRRLASRPPPA